MYSNSIEKIYSAKLCVSTLSTTSIDHWVLCFYLINKTHLLCTAAFV